MCRANKPLIIPIFLPHAGCPHRCVFCDQTIISGRTEAITPEQVIEQIRVGLCHRKSNQSHVQVAFYGGNFLGQQADRVRALLKATSPFVLAGAVNSIRFSTRPDTIDAIRLELLENHPVRVVELGVQSMDNRILDLSARGHSAQDTANAVRLLKQYGCKIGLQIMIGLPGDSPAASMSSAEKIVRLAPDFVRIYPTVVLDGSLLAKRFRQGDYVPLSLDEAVVLTKRLYLFFTRHRIPVIRMGLQASSELDRGSATLAGPYHPAFGHLVMSAVFLDKASALLKSSPQRRSITFAVHPHSISRLQGIRKHNIAVIKKEFSLTSLRIQVDDTLGKDELRLA